MIFVNRNKILPPSIFLSTTAQQANIKLFDFYSLPLEKRGQRRFADRLEIELKNGFIDSLRYLFTEKCAFCESLVSEVTSHLSYTHFRPKSGARGIDKEFAPEHYWWLRYNWENIYFSCTKCDAYKNQWFPVEGDRAPIMTKYEDIIFQETNLLLDPCNDKPEEHLIYSLGGEVDFLTSKGRVTIEILKLNRRELVLERKKAVDILFTQINSMDLNWAKTKKNREEIKRIALIWDAIFSGVTTQSYLGIQRQFLSKWLSEKPDVQEYILSGNFDLIRETRNLSFENSKVLLTENFEKFNTEALNIKNKTSIVEEINLENIRHVYLEKLILSNYKCFDHLMIELPKINLSEIFNCEPWLLFLGENGVGKTSILKAIALALSGQIYFKQINITGESLLKDGKKAGYIQLFLEGDKQPIIIKFSKKSISSSIKHPIANVCAYGAIRLVPNGDKIKPEKSVPNGIKIKNLFDYSVSLADAKKWLISQNDEIFNRVALSLKDLLELGSDQIIYRDKEKKSVFIKKGTSQLEVAKLSEGYMSVFTLVIDIISSYSNDKISFDIAEGIVLIDEIGTHLHPRWKMTVVNKLRQTFPKLQFIVTSHEPLCLRGLKKGEVAVLNRESSGKIFLEENLPDPSTLRVDQLLTSQFFGLYSAIDPETEKIFNEYYGLLAKEKLTAKEQNRKLKLSTEIPKLEVLGNTLREDIAIYIIDELLAKNKKSSNAKDLDSLKKVAKDRVKEIWDSMNNKEQI